MLNRGITRRIAVAAGSYLAVLAMCLMAPSVVAATRYSVAVDREFAPFEFVDEQGRVQGMAPDVLRAIGKAEGVVFRFHPMSWTQAVDALRAGRVDIVQMIRTDARAEHFAFSDPFAELAQGLFRRRGDTSLNGLDALAGRRIALQRHDIAEEMLSGRDDFQRVPVDNKRQGLELLDLGDIDGFVMAERPGVTLLRRGAYPRVELARGGLYPRPLAFAVRRDRKVLAALLKRGLARLRHDGELAAIVRRWETGQGVVAASPVDHRWLLGIALLVVLLGAWWWVAWRRGSVR